MWFFHVQRFRVSFLDDILQNEIVELLSYSYKYKDMFWGLDEK